MFEIPAKEESDYLFKSLIHKFVDYLNINKLLWDLKKCKKLDPIRKFDLFIDLIWLQKQKRPLVAISYFSKSVF